jgi:hypothetical protein
VSGVTDPERFRYRGLGVAVFACLGQVVGVVPALTTPAGFDLATWLFVPVPFAVVSTLLVFLWVLPRVGSRGALVLGLLALASLLVFRLGVTLPLAAGAMVAARDVPDREEGQDRLAFGVLVLAWLTLGVFALLVIGDAFA